MELTLPTLNQFCENILQGQSSIALKPECCNLIIDSIRNVPKAQSYWHIRAKQGKDEIIYVLWEKRAWLVQEEYIEEARRERKVLDSIVEARKEAYIRMCKQIAFALGVSEDQWNDKCIIKMADKIFERKHAVAQELFDLDLTNIPDLPDNKPYRYVNLDEGYAITI